MCSRRMLIYLYSHLSTKHSVLLLLKRWNMKYPVVASAEGGIQDIIDNGNSGYTVEKNNPSSLATSIERLLKDPELFISMGKAGRKLFEEKFTEEVFEKRMKGCLEKAIVN